MVRSVDDECCGFIDKFLKSKPAWKIFAFFGFLEFFLELSNISEVFSWTFNFMSFVWLVKLQKVVQSVVDWSIIKILRRATRSRDSTTDAIFSSRNFAVQRSRCAFTSYPSSSANSSHFFTKPVEELDFVRKVLTTRQQKAKPPNFTMSPFYIEFYESSFPLMR